MAIKFTQTIDSPPNVIRFMLHQDKVTGNTYSKQLGEAQTANNGTMTVTTTKLANGRIRVTYVHTFPTMENLNAWKAVLYHYEDLRMAYMSANDITYDATTTEI